MTEPEASAIEWMDLSEVIELLRDQIAEARARLTAPAGPGDRGVGLTVGDVTVELGVELARVAGGHGGLRFGVAGLSVGAGGKREQTTTATHRLTVCLKPHGEDGGPMEVRDRD